MAQQTPETHVSAPTSIKAISSTVLAAYADGTHAKLDPVKVEAQLQKALGAELLEGNGRWRGHATVLLALGNPAIAETRMESDAWQGACEVVADYLITRFLPGAKDIDDARYTHQHLGAFTLPELTLLPATVGNRVTELEASLNVHSPRWRDGIDALWRSTPQRAFHTALCHIVAEGLRDRFTAWVGHSLSLATRLSQAEAIDHIAVIAKVEHKATSDKLLRLLTVADLRLMTPMPKELHEEYGKNINELLDKLEATGAGEEVKKIRAMMLVANLSPNDTPAATAIPSI